MSFVDEVDSLKTKLHLHDMPAALRIGLVVLCAIILFILFQGLWQLGAGDTHLIEARAQGSWQEDGGEALQLEGENEALERTKEPSSDEAGSTALISVHVVGAVKSSGLYQVPEGSRVQDAIAAAGGMSEDAQQGSVNLARIVSDGEQIVVASKDVSSSAATSSVGAASSSTAPSSGSLVNINTADANALMSLSGIGESTANKIITDREKNGPFKTKKDITRVSGIGDKKYEAIKDSITV